MTQKFDMVILMQKMPKITMNTPFWAHFPDFRHFPALYKHRI